MNKIVKIFIAVFGAVNVVFSFFIPIAVALLFIDTFGIDGYRAGLIAVLGGLSSFYRAFQIGFIRNRDTQ